MRNKVIFLASGIGLVLALVSAYIFSRQPAAQPPLFKPAANPYSRGIYSNGMIESDQEQGENINIYPEVAGPVTRILVTEGQTVRKGDPLVAVDDSVQRAASEQQKAQAEAAAAVLRELQAQPAEWSPPQLSLSELTLPADLPVSVPSDLVRQRPDILAAEATAHASSASIGVATAALLPSLTLSGAYSASGTKTNTMLDASGRAWSFGGSLTAPLFQGGTLWFKRKAAIDSYQQAMALYRQTVLSAFGQVADTLRALDHDAAALKAQDEALRTANEALHIVQINYEAGLNTYLDVLSADAQYHQAMINDLEATAVRYQDTVALYVALGGGWWGTKP